MDRTNAETLEEHIFALEEFVEQVMPWVIAASPNRPAIEALLRSWADRDTSDQVEVRQGDLAETVLRGLATATDQAGT